MMKKILCIVLALSMVMCLAPNVFAEDVIAEGKCGDSVTWKITSDDTLTISGTGDMYSYASYYWSKYANSVYYVVIEDGITSLANFMFDGFKFISEIKIPDSVTNLGIGSFGGCVNLETVEIGKGMNTFDNTSFGDCLKLEKIIVSPENEKFADVDGVLFNKEKTELICFPAYWINSDENRRYDVEKGVESDYILPDSVTSVAESAFCSKIRIRNFYTENNLYFTDVDGVLFNKDKTELVRYPSRKEGSAYAVSDDVLNIREGAFAYAENLTGVTLPQNISEIKFKCFYNCTGLKNIVIPQKVTKIGNVAFAGCENLECAVLPDSVETLEVRAFDGCVMLSDVEIPRNVKEIPFAVFRACESLKNIKLPYGIEKIDNSAFGGCESLEKIDIPQSVNEIAGNAFASCGNLETVTFRNGGNVTFGAFKSCANLKRVNIFSDSIKMDNVFYMCKNIKDVYFAVSADNVTDVEEDNKVCINLADKTLEKAEVHYNTPCTVSSVTENEGKTTVSVNAKNIDAQSKVTVGFYKNGALADIKVCDVSDLTAETDKDFDTVKIMAFPSLPSLEPLCIKEEL